MILEVTDIYLLVLVGKHQVQTFISDYSKVLFTVACV